MTLRWWWLSFADPTRPVGEQFSGVAIVQAHDMASAVVAASLRGLNPGGEIAGVPIPPEHVPAAAFRDRLLSREEAEAAGEAGT